MRPITAVSTRNFKMMLSLQEAAQSWVNREYSSGLKTHPCVVPVLMMILADVSTDWGLPVSRSKEVDEDQEWTVCE